MSKHPPSIQLNSVPVQRRRFVAPRGAGIQARMFPGTSALIWLYVFLWGLDERLAPGGEVIVPLIRWLIVALSLFYLGALISSRSRNGWAVGCFLGSLGLTVLAGNSLFASTIIYARVFSAGILSIYVGTLNLSDRAKVARVVISACAVVVTGSLIFGLLAPNTAVQLIGTDRPRLYGLTIHPAILGYFGAFVIVVFSNRILLRVRRPLGRICDFGLLAIGASVLLWADSRTGEVAAVIGFSATLTILYGVRTKAFLRQPVLPAIIFSVSAILFTASPILFSADLIQIDVSEDKYSLSTEGRIEIWQEGLAAFGRNIAIGNGLGTRFYPGQMSLESEGLFYYHNVIINYLAKAGILGTAPLLVMLLSAPIFCIRFAAGVARRGCYSADEIMVLTFSLAGCVTTTAFATTEAALQNLYPSFLIYFLSITLTSPFPNQLMSLPPLAYSKIRRHAVPRREGTKWTEERAER